MESDNKNNARVDEKGNLVLPPELLSRYGLKPGSSIRIEDVKNGLQLSSPTRLAKLYIEPTNRCNLDCRTCIRNVWDEPPGIMSETVFNKILEGLKSFTPPPTIFFGGFGEPLFHTGIIEMVEQTKKLGSRVELITNGTLLTLEMSKSLIAAGLDMLWVSLDGSTPESYTDIRLGAALPQVIENILGFNSIINSEGTVFCCSFIPNCKTQIGIEFVAMKRNIADLPNVLNLGQKLGASKYIVTNVLPYTQEMCDQVLYHLVLGDDNPRSLSLPRMDGNEQTHLPLSQATRNIDTTYFNSNPVTHHNQCPFIQSGSAAIRWDGNLSPCLPLMHDHTSYVSQQKRSSKHWSIGNLANENLSDLWYTGEHISFRQKVQAFDFPPCTSCGRCDLLDSNEEDCLGNSFPTCGGCLWAQGVIQCP